MPPKPIWKSPPFVNVFADHFVQGTELDGGHIVYSCQALMYALAVLTHDVPDSEIAAGDSESAGLEEDQPTDLMKGHRKPTSKANLSLFSENDFAILKKIKGLIDGCMQIGITQVKDGESFLKFLSDFCGRIKELDIGGMMAVPGGWNGESSAGTLLYVIERKDEDEYSFVTCNGGCSGIEYHPSTGSSPVKNSNGALSSIAAAEGAEKEMDLQRLPTAGSAPKLKFKTCIRIDNISLTRICDKAFWTAMMSQWMKKPEGEYQRAEVIYDVLLPWIAGGRLLPHALAETKDDHRSAWRTPCRSGGSSAYKSLWEAVRYICLHMGLQEAQLKELSFCIRTTFLDLVSRDLHVMSDPSKQFEEWEIPESLIDVEADEESKTGERSVSTRDPLSVVLESAGPLITNSGGVLESLAPLHGKPIGLYFSGSWCGPCGQFTPLLKSFYTDIKREGKPFEIVFVSHDRSQQEFTEYFSSMPWHALPFTPEGRRAAQRLVQKYKVSGIPTLILFRDLETAEIITLEGRQLVQKDPHGNGHPWSEGLETPPREISSADLKLIRYACEETARSACKERVRYKRLSSIDLEELHSQMEAILETAEMLPAAPDLASERESTLPPEMSLDQGDIAFSKEHAFTNMELLSGTGMDALAGAESTNHVTDLANMLEMPECVKTVEQALVAVLRCESVVDKLLKRAADASASSRLASQHQIIEFIAKLFTRVLPIPEPSTVAISFQRAQNLESSSFGATSDDENDGSSESIQKETAFDAVQKQGGANAEAAKKAQDAALSAAADAKKAAKDEKEREKAAKEAAVVEARQMSAMTLLAAWPHLDFDVVVGALEVNGDSMSIAGNWLLDKDNATARQMIASKREAMRSKSHREESKSNEDTPTDGRGSDTSLTEEDLYNAGETDQFGPKRSAAAAFRKRLLRKVSMPQKTQASVSNSTETAPSSCIWASPLDRSSQLRFLHAVYKLLSTFGGMWQAIELPNRPLDAERTCVTMCAISIFDAVIRMPAGDKPLVVSSLLSRDGGYAISTAVCQDNRPLDNMSSTMQLHRPWAQMARSRALNYLSAMRRSCSKTLFLFRQPQKIELRKYSSTCVFLKRVLARCGFELIPRNARRPPPEIEALCHWLFEPETELATKHPEFALMRDIAALGKFLLTMQTREHELMSRRQDRGEAMRYINYSFTFEEGGRKSTWDLRGGGMRWDVVGFRGAPDKDTADIDCFAFGNRRLFFGEGLVCHSPADASLAIGTPMPTEDDVLHADDLPLFGDTLSREESEMLHGFLTVDYARIPLILNFFAEKDRVTYLFNTKLQSLLLAVVFESGPWVPNSEKSRINRVPERQTYSQKAKEEFQRMQDARLPPNRRVLGTPHGLLLNELFHSPGATLGPILSMLHGTVELMNSPVYSPDASFILFMATLAIDIESYIDAILYNSTSMLRGFFNADLDDESRETLNFYRAKIGGDFLRGSLLQALERWRSEAENGNDMPTACVIHSFIALVHFNARANLDFGMVPSSKLEDGDPSLQSSPHIANDIDTERTVIQILGSLAFVRNWHGFGMGTLRSNMIGSEHGDVDGTDRLVRFMQAHGIDTSHVKLGSLAKFTKGGRPVYLRVGRETVRAPTFASPDMDPDRIPPADVPEHRIFSMLQKQVRNLVDWLDRSSPQQRDRQLNKIMAVALRNPEFTYEGWSTAPGAGRGIGLFVASDVDLRFSVQSAEVLWRNDELRPVPDSMVQFNDYDSMFGKEPLHCGIVKRQQHRLWVHLVGKEYDLLEWDEPPPLDIGIGMPGNSGNSNSLPPYWTCAVCTMFNQPNPQTGLARNSCAMCDSPRPPSKDVIYVGTGGTKYDREFDPYSEEPHPNASENWVLDLLKPIILHYFPPDKPMKYKLLFPHDALPNDAAKANLIGLSNADKGNATWKEFVCYKFPHKGGLLHVFNLVSHGRKVYRSLIYSSQASLSPHSLPVNIDPRSGAVPDVVRASVGDLKEYRKPCASLEIVRQSKRESGGRETLLPSRLLQGVVPSSLLDAYRFWQDAKDMVIRGDPVDSASQWFNYAVEIHLPIEGSDTSKPRIVRSSFMNGDTGCLSLKAKTAVSMLRSSSSHLNAEDVDEVDEATLMLLVQLGYSPAAGRMALRKCNRNVEQAAMWLMDESNSALVAACDKQGELSGLSAPPLMRTASQEGRAKNLVNEGFDPIVVNHALDLFQGEDASESLARTWLSDPNNASAIATLVEDSNFDSKVEDSSVATPKVSNVSPSTENTVESKSATTIKSPIVKNKSEDTERYELIDLVSACNSNEDSAMRKITRILCRIENVSHILVWAKLSSSEHTKEAIGNDNRMNESEPLSLLDIIDLPRLKMRLRPRIDPKTGNVRLYLLDQSGWFLSNRCVQDSSYRENKIFTSLLAGLQHSIIIENDMSQMQVLLANHDVYRPSTQGLPFTTDLVFARGSVSWIEVMERRYYLYPIHTSKTFLQTNSLASMMYLILLKLLNRDYIGASKLVDVVAVDTLFTPEERWVFDLIQTRTADDYHPDAHAVRLKMLLSVHLFSENEIQWRVHVEADAYLAKRAGVSTECRLSESEELDILTMAKQGTPRIKNQSRLLAARKSASRAFQSIEKEADDSKSYVEMEGANVRIGGQPWWKLAAYSPEHIIHRIRSRASFVQYKEPEGLKVANMMQDDEIFNFIWKDEIMADEENGANRQLGILFLYKLAMKEMQCLLLGDDVTRSFVEIYAQMFHLKMARWGREQVNEGEEQVEPSREMIKLSVMLRHPERSWQSLPKDPDSKRLLARGLEVNSRMMNSQWAQMLKIFYEFWEREFTEVVSSSEYEEKLNLSRNQMNSMKLAPLSVKTKLELFRYQIIEADTLPAIVESFGCQSRVISSTSKSLGFTLGELRALCLQPLQEISIEEFTANKTNQGSDIVSPILPFDVSKQKEAKTPIASEMIERMKEDMQGFAKECSESMALELKFLSNKDIDAISESNKESEFLESAVKSLKTLILRVEQMASFDALKVDEAATNIMEKCENVHVDRQEMENTLVDDKIMYKLKKLARHRPRVDLAFVTGTVMCTQAYENLRRINPFLSREDADDILHITIGLLLRTSRVILANRTASSARSLIKSVNKLKTLLKKAKGLNQDGTETENTHLKNKIQSLCKYIQIRSSSLARTVATKRFFMNENPSTSSQNAIDFSFDPRFLVFEYIFDIVLRKRQVEIINSFRTEAGRDGGGAIVQQMIMGAGKTTVVGPLLTLMLADGDRLVTQVMPGALLEQTRTVLRSRFSSTIMPKRVYTLEFERSVEDSTNAIDMIWKKMESARRHGHVVVSSPESIKSFMLKFVEHMHAIEESDVASLRPGKSIRDNEIVAGLRDRIVAKSDMADAIVRVLDLWKKGVLIMDEVDVLLHPLRSELNFPIGHKFPIDLSGYRWDLPIFLIDAIFAGETGSLTVGSTLEVDNEVAIANRSMKLKAQKVASKGDTEDDLALAAALALSQEPVTPSESNEDSAPSLFTEKMLRPQEIISDLVSVLREGTRLHAFMHAPHLVLMDTDYYNARVKPVMARWAIVWLRAHFIGRCSVTFNFLFEYICGVDDSRREQMRPTLENGLSAEGRKLLNLAADWIQTLLPHVMAKINRVSFGLLTPADLATCDKHMPYSRRVMAVPFVGKDVPSRASEFAHPDVLIGLTILAYRYSGLRKKDLQRLVTQLKQDYSRQIGPRNERPSALLFREWLELATSEKNNLGKGDKLNLDGFHAQGKSSISNKSAPGSIPVLPLPLFQASDPQQLGRLYSLIKRLPQTIHYFLCNHIFPKTMNFQRLKVSACGHELGSSMLFGTRLGFSGTPSNLLPLDLGTCQFEPGSEGKIVHTLTSAKVMSASVKRNWTAQSLLRDIATQTTPSHANVLIDTGALITGMDNREVAEFLLVHLRESVEGVVYLDRSDRKMILMREGGRSIGLDQCGVAPENYFTFYDQVHTTGMDIKQAPTAHAIVTVGKDMTFRDYAQGCYRMRGIGQGQTVELYVIPEVRNRIETDLVSMQHDLVIDVPAWLLLNSIRMEGLQFVQLQLQELHNGWRKRGLASLTDEVRANTVSKSHRSSTGSALVISRPNRGVKGIRRFLGNGQDQIWLRKCIGLFRENIGFPVPDTIPQPKRFVETVDELVEEFESFCLNKDDTDRIKLIKQRVIDTTISSADSDSNDSNEGAPKDRSAQLQATVVHENEKQQEEEAQKQVRQQKIKQSAFARDDEQPHPWRISLLARKFRENESEIPEQEQSAFYQFREFTSKPDIKPLAFPSSLLLSDNFFRTAWVGLGDRRLKNVGIIMEWIPVGTGEENDLDLQNRKLEEPSKTMNEESGDDDETYAGPDAPSTPTPAMSLPTPLPTPNWKTRMQELHAQVMKETELSPTEAAAVAVIRLKAEMAKFEKDMKAMSVRDTSSVGSSVEGDKGAKASKHRDSAKRKKQARAAFYPDDVVESKLELIDFGQLPKIELKSKSSSGSEAKRYMVALSLAEGETIRRLLHEYRYQPVLKYCGIALRTSEGRLLDASPLFPKSLLIPRRAQGRSKKQQDTLSCGELAEMTAVDVQCLRFFNSEMYYDDSQTKSLAKSLKLSPVNDRLEFFEETLRLRQRERNLWTDTPVAKIFTLEKDWHLMRARSALNRLNAELNAVASSGGNFPTNTLVRLFASPIQQERRAKSLHLKNSNTSGGSGGESKRATSAREHLSHEWTPSDNTIIWSLYNAFDDDKDGLLSVEDFHRISIALRLNFDVQDCVSLVRLVDSSGSEKVHKSEFANAFLAAEKYAHLPSDCAAVGMANVHSLDFWDCPSCNFMNAAQNDLCVACQCDWTGSRAIPADHWVCVAPPGCTKLNHDSRYYCEICGLSRPNLATSRF